ncbi:hypothetical protein DYB28_005713 [Aphanomyces astaci]|uniref:Uncharacterized protein n=1 Tax=Aphanomyces astaci TaxID=112090 RepID=A0A9X8HC27_APHAT|nr:hypothetical protein DYB28_005713 [Aphanomyces astaci]
MPLPHTAPTPSSRHHPKLSERLVPCLRRAFSKLDGDANPFLTKADMLKHNQVLAEAHVVRHLDKMETDREFHTKGTARPCHTSRKQCGAAYSNMGTADQHQVLGLSAPPQVADIYSEPRFTPQVPCKQSPRSLAW